MLLNKNHRKSIITSMKGRLGSSALLKNKNIERKMTIVVDATLLYFKLSEEKSRWRFLATPLAAQVPKAMRKNSGGIPRCYQTFHDDCTQPWIQWTIRKNMFITININYKIIILDIFNILFIESGLKKIHFFVLFS